MSASCPASTRDDHAEHPRTGYGTFGWLLEPMPDAAGFEITEVDFRQSIYGACTRVRR
ncbi:hypothetical protein [Streptosporangium sp. V21-05]|uniref:hypothetical protein n=1 Tax=Streptosporangium sp. V21-05 TaxID=3446115 RepID=UPI003F53DDC9